MEKLVKVAVDAMGGDKIQLILRINKIILNYF